jgi:phage shock protein A
MRAASVLEPLEARVPVRAPRLERMSAPAAAAPLPADLLARVGQVVTRLVERLEDPVRMLRLSRMELEGSLMAVNRKIRRAAADLRAAQDAALAEASAEQGWSDKADVALAHGRDDLARQAIVQRVLAGQRRVAAQEAVEAGSDTTAALQADAERLRSAIADVWLRQRALTNRFGDAIVAPDEATIDQELDSLKAARLARAN